MLLTSLRPLTSTPVSVVITLSAPSPQRSILKGLYAAPAG